MAFKTSANTIIDDSGNILQNTFETVSGTTQSTQVKIKPSDGAASDFFGYSVAVGCGRIVVGAYGHDLPVFNQGAVYIYDLNGTQISKIVASSSTADFYAWSVAIGSGRIVVGAFQADDNGLNSGSAYVYDLNGTQLNKFKPGVGDTEDNFGSYVAVGSGRIVIGAPGDDDNGSGSGAAYIFNLSGTQLAKIKAPDGIASDEFGSSVAIGCGRIVVGAISVDSTEFSSGAAYIFDLNGTFLKKIEAPDPHPSGFFGYSASIGNGRIVIGRILSNNGDAYIFDLDGTQIAKIVASDGGNNDQFGVSVSVNSGFIVVGARNDDDVQTDAGAAYIYSLNGTQIAKIKSNDALPGLDNYGRSVAIGCGRIVCGSPGDDDLGSAAGAAYIYKLPETMDIYFENILDTHRY